MNALKDLIQTAIDCQLNGELEKAGELFRSALKKLSQELVNVNKAEASKSILSMIPS